MLSVCIPTYNRKPFLEWTVAKTKEDFPDAKIVISDNASTDGSSSFEGIRYIRQHKNVGAFANFRTALLAANTEFCIYLGDDDYLLPDEVWRGVRFLQANPDIVCYYAPCQLYDEVNQKPEWEAFYFAEDRTFKDADQLWNFVMKNHVWPEHTIWRRAWLEKILQPRVREYWCFIDLANAFAQGPVHFAKAPFYRNITQHPVGGRAKLGDMQCLTDFDEYRGGLEILAYELFKDLLKNVKFKRRVNQMIAHFIALRLNVAHRLHAANGRIDAANALSKRLMVCGG